MSELRRSSRLRGLGPEFKMTEIDKVERNLRKENRLRQKRRSPKRSGLDEIGRKTSPRKTSPRRSPKRRSPKFLDEIRGRNISTLRKMSPRKMSPRRNNGSEEKAMLRRLRHNLSDSYDNDDSDDSDDIFSGQDLSSFFMTPGKQGKIRKAEQLKQQVALRKLEKEKDNPIIRGSPVRRAANGEVIRPNIRGKETFVEGLGKMVLKRKSPIEDQYNNDWQ